MAPGLGFGSSELQLDPDLVNRVVGWLEQEQPTGPVPLELATRAAAAETHAEAALDLTGTFAQAGDNQYTVPSGGDNVTTYKANDTGKGNSAAYLAARLKKAGRDDLLQQIGPGKPYRSMRAAAIEAGIVKPVPTVRLKTIRRRPSA